MKPVDLLMYCHMCGGAPKLIRVGDQKEYLTYICSECYNTPVHYDEASTIAACAASIWNKRIYEALFINE